MLYHHESVSRGNDVSSAESSYMKANWHRELLDDPYYNTNLKTDSADFEVDYSKPEAFCRVYAQELSDGVVARASDGVSAGQEFSVTEDGLCAIGLRCAVSGRRSGKVRLSLRGSRSGGGDLAAVEVSAAALRNGEYNLFAFDPIRGAAGKKLYFYVEFLDHSSACALELLGSSITSDAIGPHLKDHKPASGTLSFSIYCHRQFRHANPLEPSVEAPCYWSVEEVSESGERVTHLYPNDCYKAHLSIYHFATQFCQGGIALDAGSGAGYGTAYLAENGARFVWGVELSDKAVAFSRHYFKRPNLRYRQSDLQAISDFPDRSFDMIFSSNVLEHVPDVTAFFRAASRLLKPEGALVIAVPPIIRESDWAENIDNIYHLNIWTPRQWQHTLSLFFSEIEPYWHGFHKPGATLDFMNTPEQSSMSEKDFIFTPISMEALYKDSSLTVIFVARKPRAEDELPPPSAPLTFVEGSFTK
jgi:2-polyprenyl-3-methyl-5-hydroxy-6-metoxy-1,4-benzoquinol methylase